VSLAALIAAQRAEHGIPRAVSCRALGVSQAWFYKWRRGDGSLRRRRRAALAAMIAYLFKVHRGTYGSPRITADLREMGWRVSENTVATLMNGRGLVARRNRKWRSTTRPDRSAGKAPDALRRDFRPPQRPNSRWCADLTGIPTDEGQLHLAAVLDLHGRRCVGFAMGTHHDAALARAALCMAIAVRGGPVAGVVLHSEQGGEYTGRLFAQACHSTGVTQSMGCTGSALDNAVAEAFNSTLEFELLSQRHFATRDQARWAAAAWIDEYNTQRRHSTNGMLNPVAYENTHAIRREPDTPQVPPDRRVA
jgi:putative transposase